MKLRLSAPKSITFIIAVIMATVGLLITLDMIKTFLFAPIWWVLIAFGILTLGNLIKDF